MVNRHVLVTGICAAFALSGCGMHTVATGPEQHESHSVDLDKSEQVHAQLKMPMGDLNVRGGATKLMDADFTYNVPAWKPDIRYMSGDLVVEQNGPSSSLAVRRTVGTCA